MSRIKDLEVVPFEAHHLQGLDLLPDEVVSLEDIKNSPIICSPLRLYDCSISVDGAAACIISKDKSDIKIIGSDLSTDFLPTFEREDNTSWDGTIITAKNAYKQADVGPSDIDVAELHDAFTIVELIGYEDLGFAEKGKAYKKLKMVILI